MGLELMTCPTCSGYGMVANGPNDDECSDCAGTGQVWSDEDQWYVRGEEPKIEPTIEECVIVRTSSTMPTEIRYLDNESGINYVFVPIARVLEIVRQCADNAVDTGSDYWRGCEAEAKHILRLLREEFEPE